MSGCYKFSSKLFCFKDKGIKFDLPVAEHIRIGCSSLFIFREHIIYNPEAVCFTQIDNVKRDSGFFCHHLREHNIILPVAVALEQPCCIMPVPHEKPAYIISLFLKQPCCNA